MAHLLKWLTLTLFIIIRLESKDLGIYGSTASIGEEDLILYIQKKMQNLAENETQALFKEMQKKIKLQFEQLMEVKGIQKATTYSIKLYDPSITIDQDILNDQKQMIVKKGTLVNPLTQITLENDLIFFDATDPEQLNWANSFPSSVKWILVKGYPFKLEEQLMRPVYFDQLGVLTKKFGIDHVPAHLSQAGSKLKIEFISLKEE